MRNLKLWMAATILACGLGCVTSCNGNAGAGNTPASDSTTLAEGQDLLAVVNRYLVDSIGTLYAPGQVTIPCVTIVADNQDNPDSVLVWGDFWVYNYNVAGDTLKTVSGGSHPGLMCVRRVDGVARVVSFEQVEDGHGNEASARSIFGDMYEAFRSLNSDPDAREQVRARSIADYVKRHALSVKYYQDYGWPASEIPAEP